MISLKWIKQDQSGPKPKVVEGVGFFLVCAFNQIRHLLESYLPIIQFLLPEFLLENFILISVDKEGDCFQVHLQEKNTSTDDPDRANLLSKGFFPLITIQDFPIGGHKVFLHIKRRRWLKTKTQKVVYRDWTEVEKGTRMTSEFARYAAHIFVVH